MTRRELDQHGQPKDRALFARRIKERGINELIGLSKGIIADGRVVQPEAEYLLKWLEANPETAKAWPANVISARLYEYLKDGVLDEWEQADLKACLESLAGAGTELTSLNMSASLPFDDPPPNIDFCERSFCFTGKFYFGSRKACANEVLQLGGLIKNSITQDLDYLVVGLFGSQAWRHSSFGGKLDKAVDYNDSGKAEIYIIGEDHWSDQVAAACEAQ